MIMEEKGVELTDMPDPNSEWMRRMEEVEARITTSVDVGPFVERKRTALAAHASQMEESFFGRIPPEAFDAIFARESFIRSFDTTGSPVPEDDLFAGIR
jgi:LmbE family N-acetylglucosaminyl deacetylase